MTGWRCVPPTRLGFPPPQAATALGIPVPGRKPGWVAQGQMTNLRRVLVSPGFLATAPRRPAAVAAPRARAQAIEFLFSVSLPAAGPLSQARCPPPVLPGPQPAASGLGRAGLGREWALGSGSGGAGPPLPGALCSPFLPGSKPDPLCAPRPRPSPHLPSLPSEAVASRVR